MFLIFLLYTTTQPIKKHWGQYLHEKKCQKKPGYSKRHLGNDNKTAMNSGTRNIISNSGGQEGLLEQIGP